MKKTYSKARIRKDKKFDGEFFFGVKTTGIFCRPSCPSPVAKEENVIYFETIFEALEKGFRPCLRCRPDVQVEYYNGNIEGTSIVARALKMIFSGFLSYYNLKDLADTLKISDRHLRKLFWANLGVPPVKIARYHKSLFAKKLLLNSDISITDIAFSSGFGSLRQFNQTFKETFNKTPTAVRKERKESHSDTNYTRLFLKYTGPFNLKNVLKFLQPRAINGVEVITDESYSRTFRTHGARGFFIITDSIEHSALELKIECDDIRCYMEIYNKVRRMFDLDTSFSVINKELTKDTLLSKGMINGQVPRLPVAFNPYEFVVRAILGQQITVKAATTLAGRIVKAASLQTDTHFPEGLDYFFPDPSELTRLDLKNTGITGSRQATIKDATEKIIKKELKLTASQPFNIFHKDFSSIKGIGDWTVNYTAMRGLGLKDCFPAKDLGIIKALSAGKKSAPSQKEISAMAEKWRPFRSYAALCLWNIQNEEG